MPTAAPGLDWQGCGPGAQPPPSLRPWPAV